MKHEARADLNAQYKICFSLAKYSHLHTWCARIRSVDNRMSTSQLIWKYEADQSFHVWYVRVILNPICATLFDVVLATKLGSFLIPALTLAKRV